MGSLGSETVARVIDEACPLFDPRLQLLIAHGQSNDYQFQTKSDRRIRIVPYVQGTRMLACADLAVTRAGATTMTFSNGISEVTKSGSEDLAVIAKTLSRGLLMGARGNSGVILSQIFRGFYQSVGEKKELSVAEFSEALFNGAKVAYKAVMRPVEGTILTVVRESTEYADIYVKDHPECTINEYFDLLCKEAKASLDRTPELLPILKEARVVDSGGTGLLTIFDGFKAYLDGHPFTAAEASAKANEAGENHDCLRCGPFRPLPAASAARPDPARQRAGILLAADGFQG